MKKLLALVVAATCLLPGCFTATGAVIGHEIASHETPYNDNNAQEAGIALGLAADVALTFLLVTAVASSSSSDGPGFYPYGTPGEGD